MKYPRIALLPLLLTVLAGCGSTTGRNPETPPRVREYTNPVFEPILADPTVVKGPGGVYYAYGTEDTWDGKRHRVAVLSSVDLIGWRYVDEAFSDLTRPSWRAEGGIWAPDVIFRDNTYYMYYAVSVWDDANPAIGAAVANVRAHPHFTDSGELFDSKGIGVPNSIDPCYFEDGGRKYLFWGSFSSQPDQGTYGVELSEDGLSVPDPAGKFKIAAGDFEAVMIHKRGGYYYLFGSKGSCCEGAASTYRMCVGRSQRLEGPYLDKAGRDLKKRGCGTLILSGNSIFAGPGHCSRIFTDDAGQDWIFYHAIRRSDPYIGTTSRRALMLDRVVWDKEGWPLVNDGTPSHTKQNGPSFN